MALSSTQEIIVSILPLILAITVHELMHGVVAYILGDKTAYLVKRLSLDPLRHVDLIGTILLPLLLFASGSKIVFGWAKPVPINPRNFTHPRRDSALVALAGPLANFLMAILWGIIAKISITWVLFSPSVNIFLYHAGITGVLLNIFLGFFNLIPIPPLDGSHILYAILPNHLILPYLRLAPFGNFIILFLILTNSIRYLIEKPSLLLANLVANLCGIITL